MKTAEELNELRIEYETMSKKLEELDEEELEQVTGGLSRVKRESSRDHIIVERRKREEFNTPGLKRKRRAEESPEA